MRHDEVGDEGPVTVGDHVSWVLRAHIAGAAPDWGPGVRPSPLTMRAIRRVNDGVEALVEYQRGAVTAYSGVYRRRVAVTLLERADIDLVVYETECGEWRHFHVTSGEVRRLQTVTESVAETAPQFFEPIPATAQVRDVMTAQVGAAVPTAQTLVGWVVNLQVHANGPLGAGKRSYI